MHTRAFWYVSCILLWAYRHLSSSRFKDSDPLASEGGSWDDSRGTKFHRRFLMKHYLIFVFVFCVFPSGMQADDKPKQILPPDAGLPVIDWKDAAKYMGQEVIVQGKIVQTRNIGRHCFLNFDVDRTFTAIIHQEGLANFKDPPEQTYDQKLVRVRGTISDYKGKAQLEVIKPEQIPILDKELPLPPPPKPAAAHNFDGTVTVATYNTLNFFDEYDNPYTQDEGTPAKPLPQLEHLAATIRKLNADVLVLEE